MSVYVCVTFALRKKRKTFFFDIVWQKRARTIENKIFFSDPSKSGKPRGPARNTHSHFFKFVVRRSNSFCFFLSFCHSISLSLRFSLSLCLSLSLSLCICLFTSLSLSFFLLLLFLMFITLLF